MKLKQKIDEFSAIFLGVRSGFGKDLDRAKSSKIEKFDIAVKKTDGNTLYTMSIKTEWVITNIREGPQTDYLSKIRSTI